MTLRDLRDLLLKITPSVYHFQADKKVSGNYIVWAECGQSNSILGDNLTQDQSIMGTVDYFTRMEFDPVPNKIQEALNTAQLGWELNVILFEPETGYIHYEWTWDGVNGIG